MAVPSDEPERGISHRAESETKAREINTCKIKELKRPEMNTYKKVGGTLFSAGEGADSDALAAGWVRALELS
jgi:hypothetical protein